MQVPSYRVPVDVWVDLAAGFLLGRRRSFRTHAVRMLDGIQPPMRLLGGEHIPRSGPGVITTNHYTRPGFWPVWFAAAISAVVEPELYWTMTDAFTFPGRRLGRARRLISSWVLRRLAGVYGFNSMPPMPPAPEEAAERAAAVRRLLRHVQENPNALVGLAPEGCDQPGGVLGLPPPGFGRLALALARRGLPFIPVGVYEADGLLTLCFGAPYRLEITALEGRQADAQASQQVMRAIAGCLPERLRGAFSAGQPERSGGRVAQGSFADSAQAGDAQHE